MAETTLTPQTPLGGIAPRRDSFPGLLLTEVTDRSLASVAARLGQEPALRTALGGFAGCDVPGPGGLVSGPVMTLFWTAPGQWFLDAPMERHEDLAAEVRAAVGMAGSVTEQTDGWARFDLEGPACTSVLERLCAVDILALGGPAAARTVMEHIGVFLLCHHPAERFSAICLRSYAAALHHALVTAARSAL